MSREVAARALRDPIMQGYLELLLEDHAEYNILRNEWLQLEWLNLYDKVTGNVETPHVTRDGDVIMAQHFNAGASASVLKEIQRLAGDPQGAAAAGGVNINIDLRALGAVQEKEIN